MSLPSCITLRTVKGSVLSWAELDNNFICLNNSINNLSNLIKNGNMWHIPSGYTLTLESDYQHFIYGDMVVEGLIQLSGDSQLVVLNGDLIFSGGSAVGTGSIYNIDLPDFDTKVSGLTYNGSVLTIYQNDGTSFSASVVTSTDITVTGGTYNPLNGVATFYNNNGSNFQVTGFLTGYTDVQVSDLTYSGNVLTLNQTNGNNFNVTINSSTPFTGNTSGDCITDIFVSNIYGCSPLHIEPSGLNDVYIVENGGNVGIGISSPTKKLQVNGDVLFSSSTDNVVNIVGSGSSSSYPLFTIQGSSGQLFAISDSLIGSLFSVNDISGLPILEVFSDNRILMGDYLSPSLNTTKKVSSGVGLTTIYSIPTSAYTGAFFDYTVNDGTNYRAGNIMSIWDGSTIKYNETSTTDIGNTSGIVFDMTISSGNAILRTSGSTSGWTVKTIVRSI